jgi:hypothetical protein
MRIVLATGLILSAVLLLKSESTRRSADGGEPACRPAADLIPSPRLRGEG